MEGALNTIQFLCLHTFLKSDASPNPKTIDMMILPKSVYKRFITLDNMMFVFVLFICLIICVAYMMLVFILVI